MTNENDYRQINHNYIHSLWALIILLAACSYLAQRRWAALFDNDSLQALLQLSGHEDSKLARAAEQARPYELLSRMKRMQKFDMVSEKEDNPLTKDDIIARKINMVDNYNNIYDHKLDCYPNQLIYLLLTNNPTTYRYTNLKLRTRLIWYSLCSASLSLMQFFLPMSFIGNEYKYYGLEYANLLKNYLLEIFKGHNFVSSVNSIDYLLSMTIFPTVTNCHYSQHSLTGETETFVVQCTVAMNEICGKLFVAIWWMVLLSLALELWSLSILTLGALNFKLTSVLFGYRFWPGARREAELIASFRYRRAKLMKKCAEMRAIRNQLRQAAGKLPLKSSNIRDDSRCSHVNELLSEREKKKIEAEGRLTNRLSYSSETYRDEGCLVSCFKCVIRAVKKFVKGALCCITEDDEIHEIQSEVEINMFYLLYLLYLRLGSSRSRVEDVIKMTAVALDNYLTDLEACCDCADHYYTDEPTKQQDGPQTFEGIGQPKVHKEQQNEKSTIVDVMM